jgi:type VI secretion system protein ImpG
VQTLGVQVTCTNRDLPASLTWDTDRFHLEGKAPLSRIHCLRKPTKSIYSHLRRETQWQLLSHLALNYLSLAGEGGEALRDILRLYNLDREQRGANEQQISGITTLTARRVVRRPRSMPWNGFCRGLEVAVGFNKDNFVAGGVFLMASVLEVFLGLYASINSFTQLVATVNDGREIVKQWPPRAGEQTLL